MSTTSVDGMLVAWGDRLFYRSNRIVRSHTPRLSLARASQAPCVNASTPSSCAMRRR